MKKRSRFSMSIVTLFVVLAISAMQVVPVLADDAAPPPPEVTEVVSPPAEESAPDAPPVEPAEVPVPDVEEVPPTAEPVVPDEQVLPVVETQAEAPVPQPETPAEVLAQVPDGTTIVVLDESGEALPLVSEEAAEVFYGGDPQWCPVGVTPSPTAAGCSPSGTSLQAVLAWLDTQDAAGFAKAGVIWIEGSYDSLTAVGDGATTNFILNGDDFLTLDNYALTIKGGWSGSGTTITPNDPSVLNGDALVITNWTGAITLSDILFSGVAAGNALEVKTDGNITLTRVDVGSETAANAGAGAVLDNTSGTGNVLITESEFSRNVGGTGLTVDSKGTITLTNVNANNNGGSGADLDNSGATLAKNVTLTGVNVFSANSVGGLVVLSRGAIAASNVIANANNGGWGADLDNSFAATALPVKLTGSSEFKFNGSGGLQILSKGAITLNKITANNNGGNGAHLSNTASNSSTPQNVTLLGYGDFNNNGSTGLEVFTYGAIALTNVEASNNGGLGAYLNNAGDGDFPFGTLPKSVTLSLTVGNPDTLFLNNNNGGLEIRSLGAISLSGVVANGSGSGNGATLRNDYLGAVGGITIGGWGADFSVNTGYGLLASSKGAITFTNLWAWGNHQYGALLDNSAGTGAVIISGNTGYGNNDLDGLTVHSRGAITLGAIFVNGNGGTGVILDNRYSSTLLPQNVTLNGAYHDFNSNGVNGLTISSYGMITINNLYASNNGDSGALLDNCLHTLGVCETNIAKAVTLNGNNSFEWNGGSGLEITSKGIITVNNLVARDNSGFGAFLDNNMQDSLGTITVKNTPTYWPEFARNGLDGLRLTSNGTITVMDLDAYENGQAGDPLFGHGVYLHNASDGATGNILLGTSRLNWFNGLNNNFLSGLEVYSNGTVTLSNIRANNNGLDNTLDPIYGFGVLVDNSTASLPKAVMLKGTNDFYNDWSGGLFISSAGAITVNKLTANDNGSGAILDNTFGDPALPQNVTLTGFGDFYNNYDSGLEVYSHGIITLNNVNANDNGQRSGAYGYGVYLDNFTDSTLAKSVTLNGISVINNYTGGLEVHSLGAINVKELNANDNTGFGAFLDNNDGTPISGVTVTGGAFSSNNGGYGLQVTSRGAITMNLIDAWIGNNGGYGWNLDNHFSGAVGGITLGSPNIDWAFDFFNNGEYGLWAQSLGNISISGLDSGNNGWPGGGWWGARLDNAFPGATGTVTITASATGNNDFGNNAGDGLLVYSNRAITISRLQAHDNGQDCSVDPCVRIPGNGVVLDNTGSLSGLPQNITVSGYGDFYNNSGTGLTVLSFGMITLNNINASNNGQYNFWAETNPPTPIDPNTGWGVHLDNHTGAVSPKGITLNGSNSFDGNYQDGLWATSLGAIKANSINANWNRGDGAYLDNQWDFSNQSVTLTGSSYFEGNSAFGLLVFSNGAITISNLNANHNTLGGASLDNYSLTTAAVPVTVSGTNNFVGNGDSGAGTGIGLQILSDSTITLNNIYAAWNGNDGLYLDNMAYWDLSSVIAIPAIKLTGINTFLGNGAWGANITSVGAVDLTKITADGNGNGLYVGTDGNITLTCGSMTRNAGKGWSLGSSAGLITLKGVFAYGNNTDTDPFDGTPVYVRACPLP